MRLSVQIQRIIAIQRQTRNLSQCQNASRINRNYHVSNPCYSSSSSTDKHRKSLNRDEISQLRKLTAPWVRIGEFQDGLMSHLSVYKILRSLFVLKLCSFDFFVNNSMKFMELYNKLGILVEWPLRKTFFQQFVGSDSEPEMKEVVKKMQARGLQLMFCPVIEEDIEDERSPIKFYHDNFASLMELIQFTSTLEQNKPILQLKPTAIIPCITLEKVSQLINKRCKYSEPLNLSRLIEEIANSLENSSALKLNISKEESTYFFDGLRRADILVKTAKELNVHIIVDAEFYSCKPAISAITLALMARHNQNGPYVGNTIQGYLKESLATICAELEVVTLHLGVNWYGKIVRGAYMDQERYLAKKNNYPSPICNSYEDTSKSYNLAIQRVLEHIAEKKNFQTHLVVASHNEMSIRLAAQKMKDLGIPNHGRVSFAQIYGMADYLSTPLLQNGYNVYKSTPFGPIATVLPYLARRASENRSVMEGAREERQMLWKELKRRFLPKRRIASSI